MMIVDFFHETFRSFVKQYIKPNIVYIKNDKGSQTEDMEDSKYIAKDIKKHMKNMKYYVDTPGLCIYFNKQPRYYIEFIVFYVELVRYIMRTIKGNDVDLKVKLYLTNVKKKFPNRNQVLSPINVNSGVTYTYTLENRKEIIIYRDEELFKVIMHEMIHAYNVDSVYMDERHDVFFQKYFGKHNKLHINESYTDTLACIYNVLVFSIFMNVIKGVDVRATFSTFLQRERKYILLKSRDVLKHEGYVFNDKGLTSNKLHTENTHVLSYYILKALNFCYIDEFLDFLESQHYELLNDTIYIEMLVGFVKRPNYWKYISSSKEKLTSSLRMSDIDIKYLLYYVKDKLLKNILI